MRLTRNSGDAEEVLQDVLKTNAANEAIESEFLDAIELSSAVGDKERKKRQQQTHHEHEAHARADLEKAPAKRGALDNRVWFRSELSRPNHFSIFSAFRGNL